MAEQDKKKKGPPPRPVYKRDTNFRPRLSLVISEKQRAGLEKIPWGLKNQVFDVFIDDLIEMMDRLGADRVVSKILTRTISLAELVEHTPADVAEKMLADEQKRDEQHKKKEELKNGNA